MCKVAADSLKRSVTAKRDVYSSSKDLRSFYAARPRLESH